MSLKKHPDRSIQELFGIKKSIENTLSKLGYKKEYDAALSDMKKEKISAANAAKRYEHVDARKLQAMTEAYGWDQYNTDVKGSKEGKKDGNHTILKNGKLHKSGLSKDQAFKEWERLGGKARGYTVMKESRYDQYGSASVSSTGDGASKGRASSMPKQRRSNWKDDIRARARQMDRERARKRGEGKQLELKLESFSAFIKEEMAANSVGGGGVDMNPEGKAVKKRDRRSKWDQDQMFRRANGKFKK